LFDNINERFTISSIFPHFKIFSIKAIRSLIDDDVLVYGYDEIEELLKHYGVEKKIRQFFLLWFLQI